MIFFNRANNEYFGKLFCFADMSGYVSSVHIIIAENHYILYFFVYILLISKIFY